MVDSVEAAPKQRKGGTAGLAFRQHWQPACLCRIDPNQPGPAIQMILRRITENERSQNLSSYLFIEPSTFRAYVMPEGKPFLLDVLRFAHRSPWWPWFVGQYKTVRPSDPAIPVLRYDAESLLEDVLDHLGIAP